MIERKMLIIKKVAKLEGGDFFFDVPDFEQIRYVLIRQSKKYGYIALVYTIRLYVRGVHFSKGLYTKAKEKVISLIQRRNGEWKPEQKEVSKFLKAIASYKQKISQIKQQIQEEEIK